MEKIENKITKLNQNFSCIKENVLDKVVYEKLRDTGIQKQAAGEH